MMEATDAGVLHHKDGFDLILDLITYPTGINSSDPLCVVIRTTGE